VTIGFFVWIKFRVKIQAIMKTDARTAASAFVNIFQKSETEKKQSVQFAPEKDEAIILTHLQFTEKVFPHNGIMMCPVSHATSKYVSQNCETVLGHRHSLLMSMDLPEFFELVHPDDLPAVQQCLDFMRSCEPYDPETHRFITHHRIKRSDGTYVYILDEKLAVKTSSNKYLYMILFSKAPDNEKFHQVKMDVYKNMKGNFLNAYTYNPKQEEKKITPRQNDIARLIIKGLTNQEIADYLSVSIYTVKNHKQMLFRKVNVRNSMQLANYVRESAR
jgi:DNA-binding CsgD family transcriptional regulator